MGEAGDGFVELGDRVGDDVGDRADGLDAAGDLARQGDRCVHVAAEVERLRIAEVTEHVVLGVDEGLGAFGAQRPQRGGVALVEEQRVGLGGVDDRLLPVLVHR